MAPPPSHRAPHQWHAWNPQPTTQGQNRIEPTPPLPGLPPVFLAADGGAFWRAGVNPGGDAAPDRKAGGRSSEEFIDTHPVRSTLSHSLCLSRTSHGQGLTYSPYKDTGRKSVWYFIPTVPSFEAPACLVSVCPLKPRFVFCQWRTAWRTKQHCVLGQWRTAWQTRQHYVLGQWRTAWQTRQHYVLCQWHSAWWTKQRYVLCQWCIAWWTEQHYVLCEDTLLGEQNNVSDVLLGGQNKTSYVSDTTRGGHNSATSYIIDVLLGGQNSATSYIRDVLLGG